MLWIAGVRTGGVSFQVNNRKHFGRWAGGGDRTMQGGRPHFTRRVWTRTVEADQHAVGSEEGGLAHPVGRVDGVVARDIEGNSTREVGERRCRGGRVS